MVDYWALRLGEGGKYVRQGHKRNFVAVGWSRIGDLSWLADAKVESEKLADQMTLQYVKAFGSDLSNRQVVVGVGLLVRFTRDMKKNDIVLVPDTERHKFLVGKIT
jgi:predicted Mrr-cat superfamily restriction endonuclease